MIRALLRSADQIPGERRRELEARVQQHYGVENLDEGLLKEAAKIDTR